MRNLLLPIATTWMGCAADAVSPTDTPMPGGQTPAIYETPEPTGAAEATPDPRGDAEAWASTPVLTQEGATLLYVLDWVWEGAIWDEDEELYVFETDMGYQVGLRAAYLGAWSLEVIPCIDVANRSLDHSVDPDPSYLAAPRVESVYDPGQTEFGLAHSSGLPYCGVHFVVAPMLAKAEDGFEMVRWSTYLAGWFVPPGGSDRIEFAANVNLSGGGTGDLFLSSEAVGQLATSWGEDVAARLVVYRFPARALDGLELTAISPVEMAWQFQLALTTHIQVAAQLAPGSGL